MYQSRHYSKKKKRPYLLPTFLIALMLGIYLGGDLNGWWGGSAPIAEAGKVDKSTNTTYQKEDLSIVVLSTSIPDSSTLTSVTEIMAPDFSLPDLYDETFTYTLSEYRGQPIILNFWASWCAPCRVEMPAFQAVYEQFKDDGLVILAINETYIDDHDAALTFADEMGLTFPLARDEDGRVSENLYQVLGLPTTVFIRPNGSIAFTQIGALNEEQISDMSYRLANGETLP